jgi:hypothetical protein
MCAGDGDKAGGRSWRDGNEAKGIHIGRRDACGPSTAGVADRDSGWHSRGYLPHFDVPDIVQMVTFRLGDSLPEAAVREMADDPIRRNDRTWRERVQAYLDAGHGTCYLRDPQLAGRVQDSLLHFDAERYRLLAWSVMPNHVHVLVETMGGFALSRVLCSWKSYTAKEANRVLGRSGRFWHPEYFDRYIRDGAHYANAVSYIEANGSAFSSAAYTVP